MKKQVFVIQKVVIASDIREALKLEAKGKIVEITLAAKSGDKLDPAIGFTYPLSDALKLEDDED